MHASDFQHVRKVSAAVSKLSYNKLIFIEPGIKINKQYYSEVLLMQELLPVICSIAGDVFVFQQDNAPTHRAHDTVELLCRETHHSLIVICGQPTLILCSSPKFKLLYNIITGCFIAIHFSMEMTQ